MDKKEIEALYQKGYEYQMDEEWTDAAKCYKEAAELGHAKAMEALGEIYIGGWLGEEDHKKGLMWLEKAAELGDADACFALGDYYFHGYGKKPNKRLAKKWWQKAIDRGHEGAARFYLKYF